MARLHRTGILLGSCAAFILGCPDAAGQGWLFRRPAAIGLPTRTLTQPRLVSPKERGYLRESLSACPFAVREGFDSNVFQTSENPVGSFYTNWPPG